MNIDQLLPQILALDPFDREQLLLKLSESIGEREGFFVADSEVDQRIAEIEANPEESTVGREDFVSFVEARRVERRSGKKQPE